MHECKLSYSEPLLKEAVRFFFLRTLARQLGVGFIVAVAVLIFCIARLLASQQKSWAVGFFVGLLFFMGVFIAMLYVAHYRNAITKFRRMRNPEATFGYDECSIRVTSELGSATMPWNSISEVWEHPKFWLLLFSPAQFVTLPLECLDEETREAIRSKTGSSKN